MNPKSTTSAIEVQVLLTQLTNTHASSWAIRSLPRANGDEHSSENIQEYRSASQWTKKNKQGIMMPVIRLRSRQRSQLWRTLAPNLIYGRSRSSRHVSPHAMTYCLSTLVCQQLIGHLYLSKRHFLQGCLKGLVVVWRNHATQWSMSAAICNNVPLISVTAESWFPIGHLISYEC